MSVRKGDCQMNMLSNLQCPSSQNVRSVRYAERQKKVGDVACRNFIWIDRLFCGC
jgi:hypothetical protein